MNLKGKISIRVSEEQTTIEIKDDLSSIAFVTATLNPVQLSQALSRLSYTECELEVKGLDKVGKKLETDTFEFTIPKELASSKHSEELRDIAQGWLNDGWIAEGYFGSRTSFFSRDDVQYARCTISRWV